MKKKYCIILICFLLIFVITALVLYFRANISVKYCDESQQHWGSSEAYALGYNSYGVKIFKHPEKALKQIKKDYAEGFEYLRNVREMPKFSNSYEVMRKYFRSGFYRIEEDIENREVVQKQLLQIQGFVDIYENSNWQRYFPFYKSI